MTSTHHTLAYVELAAPDLASSREFYERAFGWEFNDYGGQYAGVRAADGESEVGGLNPAAAPGTGGPLVLLVSEDLAASVQSVESAGGRIISGPYDYPGGRRFELEDPAGNRLGVFAHATDA